MKSAVRARVLVAMAWLIGSATHRSLTAQRPAELTIHITAAATRVPVTGAEVRVVELSTVARTDTRGAALFRVTHPVTLTILVRAPGYLEHASVIDMTVPHDLTHSIVLTPSSAVVELGTITANAVTDGTRMSRTNILRSGSRTVAEALAAVPEVRVVQNTAGGAATVSIRGSAASGVLVLIDGVSLNDATSGVADVSLIDLDQVESIQVLPGARSARYGARAEGGVVLIRTRTRTATSAAVSAGSLGSRSVRAAGAAGSVSLRGQYDVVDGAFDFRNPADGSTAERENADAERWSGIFAARHGALDTQLRLLTLERGSPGTSYAPARSARQNVSEVGVYAAYRGGEHSLTTAIDRRTMRNVDTLPPAGLPYDDSATATGLAVVAEAAAGERWRASWSVGADMNVTRVHARQLGVPRNVGVAAVRMTADRALSRRLDGTLTVRLERELFRAASDVSFDAGIGRSFGDLAVRAALRSSNTPPSLADLFFEQSASVQANPNLRSQRIPAEANVSADYARQVSFGSVAFTLDAFAARVNDLIVWSPDYRFVWTPQNVDAVRHGGTASATLSAGHARLSASAAHHIVEFSADRLRGIQIPYRPRSTVRSAFVWNDSAWTVHAAAEWTGRRTTAPTELNTLPPFVETRVGIERVLATPVGAMTAKLRVDRLFNEKGTLIFGVPQPGRTIGVELAIHQKHSTKVRPE